MAVNKKRFKIIGATSIALFSLLTVFTATFAWFALNKKVGSDAETINAKQITGRLNRIDVYQLEEAQYQKNGYYVFRNTPSSTIFGDGVVNNNNVQMGEYDLLDEDHPILIVFTLRDSFTSHSLNDFYIKGRTKAAGFLGRTKSDGTPFYELGVAPDPDPDASSSEPTSMYLSASSAGESYNPEDDEGLVHYLCRGTKNIGTTQNPINVDCYPLSSVINFKCTQYALKSDFEKTSNNKTTLDISKSQITLRDSFVNFGNGANLTFNHEPTIYQTVGGETFQYVAMVVNYDPDVVTAIYSTYLGYSKLEDDPEDGGYGGSFYFTCDFSLEVF